MSPVEKGRYCNSCEKQVVDFSLMKDAELQAYINKSNEKVCGRFNTAQINRSLIPQKKDTGIFKHLWKLLLPGFFFSIKAAAQKALPQDLQGKDSVIRTGHKNMILGMVVMKIIPKEKKSLSKDTVITRQLVMKETYAVLNDEVKIYPNPVGAGNSCSLSFAKVQKGEYSATLTDINGKPVQQSKFYVPGENFLFHLDLNKEISAGAYLLRITNTTSKLFYNGKIVVE